MQLKTVTLYAIRILMYVSEQRGMCSAREIAATLGITESYIPRVIRGLRRAGWLEARPGTTGGYAMKVLPQDITLLDVICAAEGGVNISAKQEGRLSLERPRLRGALDDFQRQAEAYFNSMTIADLLRPQAQSEGTRTAS